MIVSGKRALLTGASGGLGHAMARHLAANGAKLVVTGRNAAQLESLASDTGADMLVADLCDRDDLASMVDSVDGFDILVANAGSGSDRSLGDDTPENVDRIIDLNLRAPMQLATAFAQRKLAAGQPGHVVLIGSLSGLAASPDSRLYNATKFGLRGFGLALRQDLLGTGIGVSLVEPGFIRDAGMFAESGIKLPGFVRTRTPADVAAGVISAIERDRGEVFVAPLELRLAATFATVAPGLSERLQRLANVSEFTERKRS